MTRHRGAYSRGAREALFFPLRFLDTYTWEARLSGAPEDVDASRGVTGAKRNDFVVGIVFWRVLTNGRHYTAATKPKGGESSRRLLARPRWPFLGRGKFFGGAIPRNDYSPLEASSFTLPNGDSAAISTKPVLLSLSLGRTEAATESLTNEP